jgi:hypothetical protein
MKKKEITINQERISKGLCQYCGENPADIAKNSKTCTVCKKARYEKYKNQPYMSLEKQKEYRRKIKLEVLEKYGGKCKCCGENNWEFLAIDHINCDGGDERRARNGSNTAGGVYSFYLKLRREPIRTDLQVLCFNCNASFGHYGYSPKCPECKRQVVPHFKMNP